MSLYIYWGVEDKSLISKEGVDSTLGIVNVGVGKVLIFKDGVDSTSVDIIVTIAGSILLVILDSVEVFISKFVSLIDLWYNRTTP